MQRRAGPLSVQNLPFSIFCPLPAERSTQIYNKKLLGILITTNKGLPMHTMYSIVGKTEAQIYKDMQQVKKFILNLLLSLGE